MNETLLFGLLFGIVFLLGYLMGRMQKLSKGFMLSSEAENEQKTNRLFGRFRKKDKPVEEVSIDETKFVTSIKTNNFEKSFDNFGNETKTKDDISSSVSKLSNLKKKK